MQKGVDESQNPPPLEEYEAMPELSNPQPPQLKGSDKVPTQP
jgi:hypothetical protein